MRWALLAIACAHPTGPRPLERDLDGEQPVVAPAPKPPVDDVMTAPSVVLTSNSPVRAEASAASARIGIVGKDARVKPVAAKPANEGCDKRWIQIEPRGWVCETNLAPSQDPPTAATPVPLDDTTAPELGTYGAVRDGWMYDDRADAEAHGGHPIDGGIIVHSTGVVDVNGERFVMASDGSLIEPRAVAALSPSEFHGAALAGTLDVGWTHERTAVRTSPGGTVATWLPSHAQVAVHETSRGFVRIADNQWIARTDLRIPALATPPDGSEHDRWFDIDLGQQVLVAYDGDRPVYATLVSTGRPAHKTDPALAKITLKLRQTTMTNSGADESYSVADVPWVMYYSDKLALHGAYWHDKFGEVHSHGCVNLAPRDARVLFAWSAPEVPPGWTGVYANADARGSVVRIH